MNTVTQITQYSRELKATIAAREAVRPLTPREIAIRKMLTNIELLAVVCHQATIYHEVANLNRRER